MYKKKIRKKNSKIKGIIRTFKLQKYYYRKTKTALRNCRHLYVYIKKYIKVRSILNTFTLSVYYYRKTNITYRMRNYGETKQNDLFLRQRKCYVSKYSISEKFMFKHGLLLLG